MFCTLVSISPLSWRTFCFALTIPLQMTAGNWVCEQWTLKKNVLYISRENYMWFVFCFFFKKSNERPRYRNISASELPPTLDKSFSPLHQSPQCEEENGYLLNNGVDISQLTYVSDEIWPVRVSFHTSEYLNCSKRS